MRKDKKVTTQEVADYFDLQFHVALDLANNPHDLQVFLNLIEAIKKAMAADMIDETRVATLNALLRKYITENTEYTTGELEKRGLLADSG
jgi:hypothetical protein